LSLRKRAKAANQTIEALKRTSPKELFEHIMKDRLRRTISPRDFEKIGKQASVRGLMSCPSFAEMMKVLRTWFPDREQAT